MTNIKGYAIATDGNMKRIAITYDVIDEITGKVTNANVKVNRIVTDELALESIAYLDNYCKTLVAEQGDICKSYIQEQIGKMSRVKILH